MITTASFENNQISEEDEGLAVFWQAVKGCTWAV